MTVSTHGDGSGKQSIAASEFKARCLRLIDEVDETGKAYVITKHGKPKAVLSPVRDRPRSTLGAWKGLVRVTGNIVTVDWSDEYDAVR